MFFLEFFVIIIMLLVHQQLFMLQFVFLFDFLCKIAQLWLLTRTFFLKVSHWMCKSIRIKKAAFVALCVFNAVWRFNIAFRVSIDYQSNVNTWIVTDSLAWLNLRQYLICKLCRYRLLRFNSRSLLQARFSNCVRLISWWRHWIGWLYAAGKFSISCDGRDFIVICFCCHII